MFRAGSEHSPRPLLPEQDQLIQQELQRRDDFLSNLLLLQRHTGMRIGECVDLAFDCLLSARPGSVGHPRTARQTEDRTLGSRGFCGLPNRRTSAHLTFANFDFRPFPATSESRPRDADSRRPRRLSRCRRCCRNHWPARPASESPHLRHRNAPLRRRPSRTHAVTRPRQPRDDLALLEDHSARLTAGIPPGTLPSLAISSRPRERCLRLLLRAPTCLHSCLRWMRLNTFWRWFAARFLTAPIAAFSPGLATALPRCAPNCEISQRPQIKHRLAG